MASRAASRVLTDHEEIRQWVEERGGRPAAVSRTAREDDPGILRIDFPGYSGEQSLEEVEWDDFFEKFDEQGLALLVQDETSGGQRSNFNKIISRETARNAGNGRGRSSGSRNGSRSTGSRSRTGASARSGGSSRKSSGRTSSRGRSTAKKRSAARPSAGRTKAGKKSTSSARRKTSSRGSGRRAA